MTKTCRPVKPKVGKALKNYNEQTDQDASPCRHWGRRRHVVSRRRRFPCSIRWFDKVPPRGIPVWYLSSGAKRTEGPSIYRNKAVLARRRTASEGRPYGDFVSRVVYSEAPEPKRRRITPEEHRVI